MQRSTDVASPRTVAPPARSRGRGGAWWWLALAYGVLTVAAFVAWLVEGDTWWTLPINATTFYWSAPGVPLLLAAVVLRRWGIAAWVAIPASIWIVTYGGLFVGSAPAAAGDLTVATYNTYIQASDVSHVAALVDDAEPDVLLVQEVQPARRGQLAERVGDRLPHVWFAEHEAGRIGGVGILSRYPIVATREVAPAGEHARRTAVVTLDVDGRHVQVVPVHLTSPCPTCGGSVLHRQAFEAETRRNEMRAIIDVLDPALPAIVGGDFNSTRRSDPYRLLDAAGFRDPQIEAGSGPGFTWPDGSGPFLRIDWVLARDLVPAAAWVGPPRASDHHPVVVELAWSDGGT